MKSDISHPRPSHLFFQLAIAWSGQICITINSLLFYDVCTPAQQFFLVSLQIQNLQIFQIQIKLLKPQHFMNTCVVCVYFPITGHHKRHLYLLPQFTHNSDIQQHQKNCLHRSSHNANKVKSEG